MGDQTTATRTSAPLRRLGAMSIFWLLFFVLLSFVGFCSLPTGTQAKHLDQLQQATSNKQVGSRLQLSAGTKATRGASYRWVKRDDLLALERARQSAASSPAEAGASPAPSAAPDSTSSEGASPAQDAAASQAPPASGQESAAGQQTGSSSNNNNDPPAELSPPAPAQQAAPADQAVEGESAQPADELQSAAAATSDQPESVPPPATDSPPQQAEPAAAPQPADAAATNAPPAEQVDQPVSADEEEAAYGEPPAQNEATAAATNPSPQQPSPAEQVKPEEAAATPETVPDVSPEQENVQPQQAPQSLPPPPATAASEAASAPQPQVDQQQPQQQSPPTEPVTVSNEPEISNSELTEADGGATTETGQSAESNEAAETPEAPPASSEVAGSDQAAPAELAESEPVQPSASPAVPPQSTAEPAPTPTERISAQNKAKPAEQVEHHQPAPAVTPQSQAVSSVVASPAAAAAAAAAVAATASSVATSAAGAPAASRVESNHPTGKSESKPAASQATATSKEAQQLSSPAVDKPQESHFEYRLDADTCGRLTSGKLPAPILNMTIERILERIGSSSCNTKLNLKLQPATNKRIRGHVMEVSAMPVELGQLTGSTGLAAAASTRVVCSPNWEELAGDKPKVRFNLILEQELQGARSLRSAWRHYPRLRSDDIPLEMFKSSSSSSSSVEKGSTSNKCQRFRVESGDFYLNLLSFRTTLTVEVTLAKLDGGHQFAASVQQGGLVRLKAIKVDELYLDHELSLSNGGQMMMAAPASPTVQVLHDHNSHHRRNNWLLDMYGNWLKHEYKTQLGRLLAGKSLVAGLNSCLD